MKRIISYLLGILLLLNVMGYYGIFLGFHYQNTIQQQQRLDSDNYTNSETITIKVPISIPYYGDTQFERVTGQFEHQGEFYRLVKQKFENDTLHIVCFRDEKTKQIEQALTAYVKTFRDHDQSTGNTNSKIVPSFIKDFISTTFGLDHLNKGWSIVIEYPLVKDSLLENLSSTPYPPPEA